MFWALLGIWILLAMLDLGAYGFLLGRWEGSFDEWMASKERRIARWPMGALYVLWARK